jgi:hypothetical protein
MKRGHEGSEENRTGSMINADDTSELVAVTESTPPSSSGDGRLIAAVRNDYAKDGLVLGHLPKGGETLSRGRKSGLQATLLDKMGERLAFERTGTRLYEALLAKLEAPAPIGPAGTAPSRADIVRICKQEHEHFLLMNEAITATGGDPTAMTPAADVSATASSGLSKVLLDPRSTFAQCLDAILIAELADNAGWSVLIELAEANGMDELAAKFRDAQETEEEHLELVRTWILEATLAGEPARAFA